MRKFYGLLKEAFKNLFTLENLKKILENIQFQNVLEQYLLKLLKAQLLGGFKGWLVKLIVKNFTKDVITAVNDTTEYVIKIKQADSTTNMEDRDEATDILNDIMRN